jgi:hypothetical protein
MANAFHPAVIHAITDEADAIIRTIESHPAYARWDKLGKEIEDLSNNSFDLERKWVKAQRFLYVAESVALAANLDKCAGRLVQERYKRLRAAETGRLNESATTNAPSPAGGR